MDDRNRSAGRRAAVEPDNHFAQNKSKLNDKRRGIVKPTCSVCAGLMNILNIISINWGDSADGGPYRDVVTNEIVVPAILRCSVCYRTDSFAINEAQYQAMRKEAVKTMRRNKGLKGSSEDGKKTVAKHFRVDKIAYLDQVERCSWTLDIIGSSSSFRCVHLVGDHEGRDCRFAIKNPNVIGWYDVLDVNEGALVRAGGVDVSVAIGTYDQGTISNRIQQLHNCGRM